MKTYRINYRVGKVKYLASFHDGVKTHKDGSAFFDIHTFKNKRKLAAFVADLESQGYAAS